MTAILGLAPVRSTTSRLAIVSAKVTVGTRGGVTAVAGDGVDVASIADGKTLNTYNVFYRMTFAPGGTTAEYFEAAAPAGSNSFKSILFAGGFVLGTSGTIMTPKAVDASFKYVDFYAVPSTAALGNFLMTDTTAVQHAAAQRDASWLALLNCATGAPADLAEVMEIANAAKAAWNLHCASVADPDTGIGVHKAADATQVITSPAATDQATANTLLNEWGNSGGTADLHAHSNSTTYHGVAAAVAITAAAASDLPTSKDLAQELRTKILDHFDNACTVRGSGSHPSRPLPSGTVFYLTVMGTV